MTKIYVIAGESSGDLLGSYLLKDLKDCEVLGIGGPLMQKEGLKSLFPMEELSIMGIWEIIPHIRKILRRIKETVKDILEQNPDVLVTIDSPGFCYRVIKAVKRKNPDIPALHYVAPSVWAWRANRAQKVAKFLDHLFCLFPFEPPYFTEHGLKATFVGHPLTQNTVHKQQQNGNNILLLPGSRVSEIKALLPIFINVAKKILEITPDAEFYLPTLPHLKALVESLIPKDFKVYITIDGKQHYFEIANRAIAASGTVSLELAQYQIPHVIAYKASFLTWLILKALVKTPYVSLPNILSGTMIVPECLQNDCNADKIYESFIQIDDLKQEKALKKAFNRLYCSDDTQTISKIIHAYSKTKS